MSSLNPNASNWTPGGSKGDAMNPSPDAMPNPGGYNPAMGGGGGGGGPRNNQRVMYRQNNNNNNLQQPPPNMNQGPPQNRRPPPGPYNQGGGGRQYAPPPPQGGYYGPGQDRGNYYMDNGNPNFYHNGPPQPITPPYVNPNHNYPPQQQQPPPPQQQMPPYQRQPSPQVQPTMNMPPNNRRTPGPSGMAQYQVPQQAPTYFAKTKVTVILVVGYQSSGKTTVAKALATELRFQYISLKWKEDAEGYDDSGINLAALVELVKTPNLTGIVIDDGLVNNKYEPYYINHILRKANMSLDILCVVNNDLSDLINRGVNFDLEVSKQAHPESFEFAEQLEGENSQQPGGAPIAVVDGSQPLKTVIESAIAQVNEVLSKNLPPLKLPPVNFIPNCPLVEDYKLAKEVIEAEFASLQVDKNEFGIPFAEPNYVLDYVVFVRKALLFQEYMLVPWVWGDKVSLIAYGDNVYVHLPSYKILFHLQEVPTPVQELVQQLKGEMEEEKHAKSEDGEEESAPQPPASAPPAAPPTVLFSLEATMLENVLYISDMMRIGRSLGSQMTLYDRINKMNAALGKLPDPTGAGPLRCLRFYPVCQIRDCLRENPFARGALFVNPDGMKAGKYDSRNYIYPCADVQTAQIRLWNGRVDENGDWVFDALARNGDTEVPLMTQNGDEQLISVYIPDDVVSTYTINDGNIIECSLKEDSNGAVAAGAKGNSANAKKVSKGPFTTTFAFEKRCTWKTSTSTDYHQYAFIYPMAWSLDSFYQACEFVKHVTPSAEE